MAHSGAMLQAVERIHEAPLAGDGWQAALAAIAGAVGGDRAFLVTQNLSASRVEWVAGCFDMSPQHLQRLGTGIDGGALPDWVPALSAGVATPSSAMVSDRDFSRSVFYNEVIRPIGDFYGLTSLLAQDRERNVYLAVGRKLGRQDYDASDRLALQRLLPHVATAMRVGWRITATERRAESLDAALEGLETGVIVADAAASVLFANAAAERLLSAGRGLDVDQEGLRAADPAATRELRRLVRECVSASSSPPRSALALGCRTGFAPLKVLVAPFRPGRGAHEIPFDCPAALVLVSDPERSLHDRKERLRRCFGLTPVEARVALEIASAQGRAAAAGRLSIREATLKTHLIHIFEKIGVSRQAELVRLVFEEGG